MTTVVTISEEAKARADELIRSGSYTSFSDVVQAALQGAEDGWMDEPVDIDELPPELRDAVLAGLADIEAGRVHTIEEVRSHFRQRAEDA